MKKKGFTLVELLAVIVILAIILAIAIPGISGIIKSATKGAFQSDAKMVLKAIEYKKLVDSAFDPLLITKANMQEKLGLSVDNYKYVNFAMVDNQVEMTLVGAGKFVGLTAYGTFKNMNVVNTEDYDVFPPIIDLSYNPTSYTTSVTITANVTDNASDISIKKWADGERDISYFNTNGAIILENTFDVTANNIYTVYGKDTSGNEAVATINISNITVSPSNPGSFTNPTTSIERGTSTSISWGATSSWGVPDTGNNYRLEASYNGGAYTLIGNKGTSVSHNLTIPITDASTTVIFRVRAENAGSVSNWVYSNSLNITGWYTQTVGTNAYNGLYNYSGRWVAVGAAGTISTSTNGTTWSSQVAGTTSYEAVYNYNGTWVTVGSKVISKSTNGTSWTVTDLSASLLHSVYNYNGTWVMVGSNGHTYHSSDALSYTGLTVSTYSYYSVYNYGGRFIAVGTNGGIITSTDGSTWSTQTLGTQTYNDVYYYSGRWVAVGTSGIISTSTNGTSWSTQTVGAKHYQEVYNYNGRWVAVGTNGIIATSTDGVTWSSQTVLETTTFNDVYYYNGKWITVGAGGYIAISTDGVTWSLTRVGIPNYNRIYNYNGRWVAVGTGGTIATLSE